MADVTISQLPQGIPSGNNILPYSTGSNTLGVPVSALFQNAGNIGIGTTNPVASLSVCGSAFNVSGIPGVHLSTTSVREYGAVQIIGQSGAYIDFSKSNPAKDYDFRIIFNSPGDINNGLGIYSETNSLMYMKRTGEVGVGTANPQATLDVNGVIRADGFTTANNMTAYYNEGSDCRAFLTNWNNTTNYNMTILGEFGNCWVHGWHGVPGSYTLTLNNIPAHTQVKYECNIHHVDSWDGEVVEIYTTNSSNEEVLRSRWFKIYWAVPHNVYNLPGTASTFSGPQLYSYTPWADTNSGSPFYKTITGVTKFTSGWYDHTSTQFVARHYTDLQTGQYDEAFYISHVRLFIR